MALEKSPLRLGLVSGPNFTHWAPEWATRDAGKENVNLQWRPEDAENAKKCAAFVKESCRHQNVPWRSDGATLFSKCTAWQNLILVLLNFSLLWVWSFSALLLLFLVGIGLLVLCHWNRITCPLILQLIVQGFLESYKKIQSYKCCWNHEDYGTLKVTREKFHIMILSVSP